MFERMKTMKVIRKYVKEVILSVGGDKYDVKKVINAIKKRGYMTIEEVDSFLENVYI